MSQSDRWQLGDVIVWIQTGTQQNAKTDSDIFLQFYGEADEPIGWVHVFERGDLGGFEDGELNCGYVGNLHKQPWLNALFKSARDLGIRIENVSDDNPDWYLEHISLDFRVGPVSDIPTVRTWSVKDWIRQEDGEKRYQSEAVSSVDRALFGDIGFEKELEIETGAKRNPEDANRPD
jgi:hypothetical protein